jgi:hypothetical protein
LITGEEEKKDLFFAGELVKDRTDAQPSFLGNLSHARAVISTVEE